MFSGRLLIPNLGCWLQGWFLLWPGLLGLGLLISGRYDWIWFNWFQVVDWCFWNLVSDVRVCRNPFQILACALVMCFYFCRSFLEYFSVGALVWQGLSVGTVCGFCKHCLMGRIQGRLLLLVVTGVQSPGHPCSVSSTDVSAGSCFSSSSETVFPTYLQWHTFEIKMLVNIGTFVRWKKSSLSAM